MTETPWPDVDLNILARRSDPDWSLERLINFAESGLGMAITVVVGGTVISGVLTNEHAWAEDVDDRVEQGIGDPERHYPKVAEGGSTPENVDAVLEVIRAHRLTATADERAAESERLREEVQEITSGAEEWKVADLPVATARRAVADLYGQTAFTLTDARIIFPMGRPLEIAMMRVVVSHVGAWWASGLMPAPDEPEA